MRRLKYRLLENPGILNSSHTSVWRKGIGRGPYICQSCYMIFCIFPKGADGKLLEKIMAHSAELSIDKALEHLNVSREKQKIILKREKETAVKELLAGRDIMAILPTGFGESNN